MDVQAVVNQRRSAQACDACRRRKVRCNGQDRCQQCSHLNLRCQYTAAKKGSSRKNAAGRGAVIHAYRKSTTKPHFPHLPVEVAPAPPPTSAPIAPSPASSTSLPITPPLAPEHPDPSFFLDLLPEYTADVYPASPVIPEAEIRGCVQRMHTDNEALSFLYIFAGVTINLARVDFLQCMPGIREQVASLVQRSLDHRPRLSVSLQPTPLQVMTSIFTEICLMGLQKVELGLLHLREAQSLVKMMHVDDAEHMAAAGFTLAQRAQWQRAYWECFIHERFSALTDWEPILLDPLPTLPEHDPSISPAIQQGWNYLIQTFLLIDRQFVDYWRGGGGAAGGGSGDGGGGGGVGAGDGSGSGGGGGGGGESDRSQPTIPASWLNSKHRQLEDERWQIELPTMLPAMQQADIIITRQWLRTMLWQMAISSMVLPTDDDAAAGDGQQTSPGGLSLTMPLKLSSELRLCITHLSPQAVGIHGSGILHKLFEITNSILDVIINLPQAPTEDTLQRVDDVLFLKKFLFSFPRIDPKHKRILNQKFEKIKELYPGMEEIQMLVASPLSTVASWGE